MVNAFKNGENENSKNDIETKLKSYDMINETEEDFPFVGDMLLVD